MDINWTPEIIIGLLAIAISVISLGFTWFSLKYQREHNYKSVKPIGIVVVGDYENKLFVRIDNSGVGPLIIKKLTVSNKKMTTNNLIDIIPSDIAKKIVWSNFVAGVENRAIQHGDKLTLIEYTIDYNNPLTDKLKEDQNKTDLRKFLRDVKIDLEYTDIYEKATFKTDRSLEWFGRHFE